MMKYIEHALGPDGVVYVESRLKAGNSLARLVHSAFQHRPLTCLTFLPEVIDRAAMLRFAAGGIDEPERSIRWFIELVRVHLSSAHEALVLFEDALSRRGDPVLERAQSRIRFYGDEVYHLLTLQDANEYAIERTLSWSDSPHQLVCILTEQEGKLGNSTEIMAGELSAWARRAKAVIVSAYDGEGFVLCWLQRG